MKKVKLNEENIEINKITNKTLMVIIALEGLMLGIFIGLEKGYPFEPQSTLNAIAILGGYRHTVMSVSALFLIPVCAREYRWGFWAAMLLGIVTLTLSLTHVIYMLVAASVGYRSLIFGPTVWSVMQIPIVVFGYRARREADKEAGANNRA